MLRCPLTEGASEPPILPPDDLQTFNLGPTRPKSLTFIANCLTWSRMAFHTVDEKGRPGPVTIVGKSQKLTLN